MCAAARCTPAAAPVNTVYDAAPHCHAAAAAAGAIAPPRPLLSINAAPASAMRCRRLRHRWRCPPAPLSVTAAPASIMRRRRRTGQTYGSRTRPSGGSWRRTAAWSRGTDGCSCPSTRLALLTMKSRPSRHQVASPGPHTARTPYPHTPPRHPPSSWLPPPAHTNWKTLQGRSRGGVRVGYSGWGGMEARYAHCSTLAVCLTIDRLLPAQPTC